MRPLITDPGVVEGYLTDASNIRGHADGVLRPRNTEDVAEIVAHCQQAGIQLTVSAARTSTTAAPVPFGGWILSMEQLDAIEHIGEHTATAQGGVNLGAFQTAIEATGRLFPPDPTSRHDCTLGAAIACDASGARSFRYGATRRWIASLEVVLPTGEVLQVGPDDPIPAGWPVPAWTPPEVKTAAGYAPATRLLDLFIGQEGTLGIITRATVRLAPLPFDVLGILAFFPTRAAAVSFVEHARRAARLDPSGELSPRCLEYLDHHCLSLARERGADVPDGAEAALFCEQEVASDDAADAHMMAWYEALAEHEALADDTILAVDDASRDKLHALRHAVPAGINEEVVRNGMPKIGTDLAVPDHALSEMMDAYEAAPMRHVLFGHIGDNHLHLNLLPRTEAELAQARDFYDQLAKRAIALGGTISAEHGVGKVKVKQLRWMLGDALLDDFRKLKAHLDPAGILGRGTLFDAA